MLPHKLFNYWAAKKVDRWSKIIKQFSFKVVWQIHDVVSHHAHHTKAFQADLYLHRSFYKLADGVIIHERSCLPPINAAIGEGKKFEIAHLGDYTEVYGKKIFRLEARKNLGVPLEGIVIPKNW